MDGIHKTAETGEGSVPIKTILNKKEFEKAAQDVGEARRYITMLVTWGAHTPERQFTEDVAKRIQKIKGERDIKVCELKSFTHASDVIDLHWMKTGKDYGMRKQDRLFKKENFDNLLVYNEMLGTARDERASVIVDIHYSPATHAPYLVYSNSKPTELKSNPIVYVEADSKEVFEEYLKIPGINVTLWQSSPGAEPLRRIDKLRASLRRFDYPDDKTIAKELYEHYEVALEGFVFHLPHRVDEKCEISREEYEQVVASAADTVIRIYDHFNSKMLKKEQSTSLGISRR